MISRKHDAMLFDNGSFKIFLIKNVFTISNKTKLEVWHRGLLHKIFSFGISGRVFSIIKFFLSGRSMKDIVKGHPPEAHDIDTGVSQDSLFGPTLFLLYINSLLKNILRSMVNVYADDVKV